MQRLLEKGTLRLCESGSDQTNAKQLERTSRTRERDARKESEILLAWRDQPEERSFRSHEGYCEFRAGVCTRGRTSWGRGLFRRLNAASHPLATCATHHWSRLRCWARFRGRDRECGRQKQGKNCQGNHGDPKNRD